MGPWASILVERYQVRKCCYRKKVPEGSILKVEYRECCSHLGCCDNCCFLSAASSRSLLLQCLWGLFSEHPGSAVERKANQWIRVWHRLLQIFLSTCYIFNCDFLNFFYIEEFKKVRIWFYCQCLLRHQLI